MFRLISRIKIVQQGDGRDLEIYLSQINTASIERSFDKMTQTAKVVLPRNLKYNNKNIYEGSDPLLRRGDYIELSAGYHPDSYVLFRGYISKIDNNVPITLLCEDEMFKLKQTIAPNLSYKSVSLKEFLSKAINNACSWKAIDAQLGKIRTQEASIGKILAILRDDYGLYSFFKDTEYGSVLYVGLAYYPDEAVEHTFLFERAMIKDGMNLIYLKKDDVKVQIKGIIIKENSKEEHTYGDLTGELRTVFQYGGTKVDLDAKCQSFLEQMNYTGYYGSFNTFLTPIVTVGDYAYINSYKYPERVGKYLIKSVNTTFGVNGGRQLIELERRIA